MGLIGGAWGLTVAVYAFLFGKIYSFFLKKNIIIILIYLFIV